MQFRVTTAKNYLALTSYTNINCVEGSGRKSQQFFSLYRVYYVSIDNILCEYVNCILPYKEDSLQLITCECFSWEEKLNFSFDALCMARNQYVREAGDVNNNITN
jgi:hypothetical protein